MKMSAKARLFAAVSTATLFSMMAVAQNAPTESVLEEIIVTAQKRSERLSDVPLSITAVTGMQLQTQGISAPSDLEKIVPGFTFQKSSYGTPIFAMRGVGFYDTSIGVSPAVTVYLDQVPLPYSSMARGVSMDLERLEALKGPQGTLFGQNSTGGAINYIAAKPTTETTAGLDVDYGRFNALNTQAFISGSLSSTVRARLTVRHEDQDDWQKGYAPNDTKFGKTGKETLGQRDFTSGRLLVDWEPSDDLRFAVNLNGWKDNSDTQAARFLRFAAGAPASPFNTRTFEAYLGSQPLVALPKNSRVAGWDADTDYGRDDHFYQGSIRGDWDLDDTASVTAITAYSRYREDAITDADGTAYRDVTNVRTAGIKSFSQELRFSKEAGPARLLVGGNYAKDITNETQQNILGSTNNGVGPFRYDRIRLQNRQEVSTWAGFASIDYALTETLSAQVSGRYTDQDRDYAGCLSDPDTDGRLAAAFASAFGTATQRGRCVTMDAPASRQLLPIVEDSLDQTNVSWRGGLNWKPDADTLLYGNVSKGYKAGSFPVLPAAFATQLAPVTQESIIAYETGFKTALADRTVQLTGAAFYYDYADKQILGTAVIPPFGNLPKLVNIPKSRVVGAEIEATLYPVKGLRLSGGVTYVNSKVRKDPPNPIDQFGVATTFVGEAFPNTPRWQGVLDAEYQFAVGEELTAFVGSGLTARSAAAAAFGENPEFRIDGYMLLDLRAGLEADDGSWRLQVWGRNVTDRFYVTNVAHLIDSVTQFSGMPVTYGLSFSYRY